MSKRIIGVDASLTSTGYAYQLRGKLFCGRIRPDDLRGVERLHAVARVMENHFSLASAEVLCIEGYSMGSPRGGTGRAFSIGELGGVLKLVAKKRSMAVVVVPPKTLKVFATGNGNATKDDMVKAARGTWGLTSNAHDEADALALLKIGEALYSLRKRRLYDASRLRALESCSIETE